VALDDVRHPDAERLAAYADGVLEVGARAEIERHLADCAECRSVVIETMNFLDASAAESTSAPAGRVITFWSRKRLTAVAAGLAVAAALVLAVRVARPEWAAGLFGARGDRPELQELIAAVANEPTRPVEGRLSGGFKYAPPPSATRGAGGAEASPEVRIAAANLEKSGADGADRQAAVGVATLVQGSLDASIASLENAVQRQPRNAFFLSDLAAAYIERARRQNRQDDLPRALAAAENAIAARPDLDEAWFNRALAIAASGTRDAATRAWTEAAEHQTDPLWRDEARARANAATTPAR
jgi:hypothetical protein